MALSRPIQLVTSAYLSNYGSASGSNMLRVRTSLRENVSFESLTSSFCGESKYFTHLKVFEKGEKLFPSDPGGPKLRANVDPHNQNIQDKVIAALKLLSFRKKYVLVQFWSHRVIGKHRSLANIDQPSGVCVFDGRLLLYMESSKRNVHVVDDEFGEEDIDPIARVYTYHFKQFLKLQK